MKYIYLFGMFLGLCSVSFASPKVGDFVVFDLSVTTAGSKVEGTLTKKITDYDPAEKAYLVETKIQQTLGKAKVSQDVLYEDEILGDAALNAIVSKCASFRGVVEGVSTGRGELQACKISMSNSKGFQWMGAVPFGLIRVELFEDPGTKKSIVLKDFGFGK